MVIRHRGRWRRFMAAGSTTALLLVWTGAARAAEPDALPSGTVSLAEALAAALLYDPSLAAYGFERRALDARALQEGRLPNPTLGTAVENVGGFGGDRSQADPEQMTVSLTQLFELAGKRAKREALARFDGRLAGWDYERARLETAARTFTAFVAGLLAQERVALAERMRALARDSVGAVRRQLDAGGGSTIELVRAQAALAQAEAMLARRQREAHAALHALAVSWGSVAGDVTRLSGRLTPLPAPLPLAPLAERLAASPDLARWSDAIARAEANVTLETARRVPDVSIRIGARRFLDAESNALVGELTLPLPIFDRNADAIDEARARLGRTRAEQRAATVGAEAVLRAGHAELLAAFEEARALAEQVLPRIRTAIAETRRGYAEGRLRYLEILEAEHAVAEAEGTHLDVAARYHRTVAELERLTGGPVVAPTGDVR